MTGPKVVTVKVDVDTETDRIAVWKAGIGWVEMDRDWFRDLLTRADAQPRLVGLLDALDTIERSARRGMGAMDSSFFADVLTQVNIIRAAATEASAGATDGSDNRTVSQLAVSSDTEASAGAVERCAFVYGPDASPPGVCGEPREAKPHRLGVMLGHDYAPPRAETLRDALRAAISNAYYENRGKGQTMETAADAAVAAVLPIIVALLPPPAAPEAKP